MTTTFSAPYYEGSSLAADVPGKFPVALAGRPYMLDTGSGAHRHQSIPLTRQQADNLEQPGEQTLNREGLWRRSQDTWDKGSGQKHLDRPESDPARFYESQGVDVWDRWSLSLLNDTDQKLASAETNLHVLPVGDYLYVADGANLRHTADISATPTWTAITGLHASDIQSVTSDGFYVYVAHGANGVYRSERGTGTGASWNTGTASLLGYVKGRLMAAYQHELFNIIDVTVPTASFSHPNTNFRWVGFAEGPGHIYAAGFSGDKSLIYRTAVQADGTALEVPVVAGQLPDGEVVTSIGSYLGFVILGTEQGLRFAVPDGNGNLEIGALIETGSPVLCFEGQGQWVWYGLTDFTATETGLGRLDLTAINGSAPAYASDLMATDQGDVLSVCTFAGSRVFAVSGSGVWAEAATKVASGWLTSGQIGFGIADTKVALFVDVRHAELAGTVDVALSTDRGSFSAIGSSFDANSTGTTVPAGQRFGETFELRLTLNRDDSDATTGPEVSRWTLRANPTATTGKFIFVPVMLAESLDVWGDTIAFDPADHLLFFETLRSTGEIVTYQEGRRAYSVTVADFEWIPTHQTYDGAAWNGTCVLKLKTVE